MTARQQRLVDAVVGGVVTVLATALLAFATGAWSGKESVDHHNADIAAIRAEVQRIRDVVCLDHPVAPQCKVTP